MRQPFFLQARANAALDALLPAADRAPVRLHEAMRYAVLAPGKRIRPVLTYATGAALGAADGVLDGPAAAVPELNSTDPVLPPPVPLPERTTMWPVWPDAAAAPDTAVTGPPFFR